jgi:phospholipid N-methyltransferase
MTSLLERFLKDPVKIGSVVDSSKFLAEKMAAHGRFDGPLLELGAGTGPITKELLRHLPDPAQLTLVELDPHLASTLRRKFPAATVLEEDAESVLTNSPTLYASIFSGIPFAVMDPAKRARMYALIQERLLPGGRFVMFQYSRLSEKELQARYGKEHVHVHFVPLNLPPAFVYECHKQKRG